MEFEKPSDYNLDKIIKQLLNEKNQSFSNFRKIKKDRIRKNSLEELRRLAETADIKVVQETNINVQSYTAATLIGSGKIDELKS